MEVEDHEFNRLKAINRAVLMSKCFNKENFDLFIAALNNPAKKEAENVFRTAANKSGLTKPQKDWLWNYLQHYNPDLAWNQSAPIGNGW
jgi:hypothetical protein